MMDYTDRHFRYLLRLISKRTLLYTEMITTQAILCGDYTRLLRYHPAEHPLALQLGGSDPKSLATCARMAEDLGYDEVNLNVGCPSNRVQSGQFGACLMKEPDLVAACVAKMRSAVSIPVTVKTRIGVDDLDTYPDLLNFVEKVSQAGCQTFIIHARKAWLKGLSPKENRTIPPLRYDVVHQLKKDFPHLSIILNGGIQTVEQILKAGVPLAGDRLSSCCHPQDDIGQDENIIGLDGVMIGRQACQDPYFFAQMDKLFYGEDKLASSREEILAEYRIYAQKQVAEGVTVTALSRHLLGLYFGTPGARQWRRDLTERPERALLP
jgi:tRNA-dihydrouridine synthase A